MTDRTDNRKKAVLQALEEAKGIVSAACKAAGIARQTFYEWKNEDSEFAAAVEDIQEVAIDYVESKLFEKIEGVTMLGKGAEIEGEPPVYTIPPSDTAIIFYLKTKAKKRGYVERQEHTGGDGGPIETTNKHVVEFKDMTNDSSDL